MCQEKLKFLKHLGRIRNDRTRKIPMRHKWGPFRVTATKPRRVWTVLVRADSDNTRTAANMVTDLHYTREKNMGSKHAVLYHLLLLFNYYICMQ